MNILQTSRIYKTPDGAHTALVRALERIGRTPTDTRYLIAVSLPRAAGAAPRFAPVVIASGPDVARLVLLGITVVG